MRQGRAERLRANRQRIATRRQQETTQAREARCVCIRLGLCLSVCFSVLRALVACKQSLVAIEFSQHRHRSFRLVIASLQIGATAQRRVQPKHFETTLRTPPAHTHRLRANRQRQATRRQQETSQATDARCVFVYPSWAVSIRVCILPARVGCLPKSLVAIEFSQHRRGSFRLVIISLHIYLTNDTNKSTAYAFSTDA